MMTYDDEEIKRSAYTKIDENTKRNYISSGNFKKSNPIQLQHNDRLKPPSYVIDSEDNNEVNRNSYEALELKNKIITEARENYKKTIKQPFKAKNYEWSLVVNIKPDTTMQDLEKLADYFANAKTKEGQLIYGFQCYQIAIHRDEGHINEQGEKVINHHAHMEFITLDRETGKNNSRKLWNNRPQMRTMQTMIAQILQMQRGEDKRISGRERIEPRKYAQMKEAEKKERKGLEQELQNLKRREKEIIQELENIKKEKETIINQVKSVKDEMLSKKQITAYIELIRKQSIGKNYPKEFFRELSNFKKEVIQNNKKLSLKEIKERINKIFKPFDEMLKENKALKQEQEKNNKANIQNPNQELVKHYETAKEIIAKAAGLKELDNTRISEIERGNKIDIISDIETYQEGKHKAEAEKIYKSKLEALESDLKQKEQKNEELLKKINKNDLNAKESDLKQKNDEIYQKENKNDLSGNSERLNDINKKELTPIKKFYQNISIDCLLELVKDNLYFVRKYKQDILNSNNLEEALKALKKLSHSLDNLKSKNPELYKYCLEVSFNNDFEKWKNENLNLSKQPEKYQGKSI